MKWQSLLGRNAIIQANEFIQDDVLAVVSGVDESSCAILLKMDTTASIQGVTYTYALVSPRLERDDLSTFVIESKCGCSVTWIPDAKYERSNPFDLAWWRGGAAAIADVIIK